MFINEAISLSIQTNICIGRKSWHGRVKLNPILTYSSNGNLMSGHIVMLGNSRGDEINKYRHWIAKPTDLLANDWMLIY